MRSLALVTAFCLLFGFVGCKRKAAKNGVANKPTAQSFDTPQAAFDVFQSAARRNDFAAAMAATTVETQQAVAGSLVFVLGFAAAFDQEKGPDIQAMLKKHGITEDGPPEPPNAAKLDGPAAMVRAIGSVIPDPLAFIGDAMKFMDDDEDNMSQEFADGQLGEVSIDGNHATAMLAVDGEQKPIEFVKSGAGWLIHIPDDEFSMGGGDNITMSGGDEDFDNFDYHFDQPETLPPPDAITLAEFDKAWKTSVDFQDRVAAEVITTVAGESGFQLFDQPDMAEKLQQKVTVNLDNVSRLQVIEAICQQVGLYPRYKAKKMAFAQGPRPHPVAFAGPFLIAIRKIDEFAPNTVGEIDFEFVAAGIRASTASRIVDLHGFADDDSDNSLTLKFQNVTGGGRELLGKNTGATMKTGSPSTVTFGVTYQLKNLLRDVETIDPIQGRLSWAFPSKITKIKFDEFEQGAVAQEGDVKVTLSKVQLGSMSQFTVDVEGAKYDTISILGFDGDGKPLENNFSSTSGFGENAQAEIAMDGEPQSLEVRIATESDRITYDFTIPAAALSAYAEMPAELEELQIKGEQPVAIKFVKLTGEEGFRTITLKVTNQTNKDIHQLKIKFDYQDANRKSLKQGDGSAIGNRVLIKAGETTDIDVHSFFMPDETKIATGQPEWIEFADLTEWRKQ